MSTFGEDFPTHAQILERVGRLEGARIERDKAVDDRLDRMEGKLDQLVAVANMGKGAWWAVVKFGAIVAGAAAAGSWIWERLPDGFKKTLIG